MTTPIRPRERDAVIQALRAGVVPRTGIQFIQVGRLKEIEAMIKDVERIADGGTSFRLVIGEYGSGKTFFLNLLRSLAMEKKLVVTSADLNPDRRLHATGGQARSLYAELGKNLATRTKPDGGALQGIVEKFILTAASEAKAQGVGVDEIIRHKLERLSEMVNGYDFAHVVQAYWRGHQEGSEQLKIDAIRWMRGEFTTKTDARVALGVRTIVDDSCIYDQLKLLSLFVRLAGFSGLLICLDELVNLYKLANKQARDSNYEQLLRILNDVLQGSAEGLGFVLGGTPEFLMDTRRGLFSYSALQSRLAENTFAKGGLVDFNHPIIRLSSLSETEFYILLRNIRRVFSHGDDNWYRVPDEALKSFMVHCQKRIGEAYFRTPRTTITAFVNLLSVLEQNPDASWPALLGKIEVRQDAGGMGDHQIESDEPTTTGTVANPDDELTTFKL